MRQFQLTILALLFAVFALPAMAREAEPDWTVLGSRTVDFNRDQDTIEVGLAEGVFTRIRLSVKGNDIFFNRLVVVFGNGQEQIVNVGKVIQKGGAAIFDLAGTQRGVKTVRMAYRSRPGRGKAEVVLSGLRTGTHEGAAPTRSANSKLLDTKTYNRSSDRVLFSVDTKDGSFGQIRFRTSDDSVTLEKVRVVYGNGDVQDTALYARLAPGELSPPVDLTGERRALREVILYKRPGQRPGKGTMELVGIYRAGVEAPPPPQFQVLDAQSLDKRADRVSFRIDPRFGPLQQIKLRSADDYVLLNNVQIVFSDGRTQSLDLIDRLGPGEETAPIDISEDRLQVREVVVYKRPSWRAGTSRLELIGLERPRRDPPGYGYGRDPDGSYGRPPSIGPGAAIPREWVLFGAATVDFGTDRDIVPVGTEVGQFERIALKVRQNDVFLREIAIVYGNGERDRFTIDRMIPAESQTAPIELQGRDRFIRQVELVHQSRPDRRGAKAVVEVYGDYARSWFGDRGRGRNYNSGWLLLGSQLARPFSSETDPFYVGERYGRLRAIRLTARRHDVRLSGVRIVYANGETEDVPVFADLRDGQSTPELSFNGRGRFIERVEVRYRTRFNFQGQGLVELWGLY